MESLLYGTGVFIVQEEKHFLGEEPVKSKAILAVFVHVPGI